MSDLVIRLRTFPTLRPEGPEAADRIEALEARVAELEADPRMALTADDLAAVSRNLRDTPLFLSDTHVRVEAAVPFSPPRRERRREALRPQGH